METKVVAISGGISWNLLCSYWNWTSYLFHNWLQWHKIRRSGALFTPLSHHIADSREVFGGCLGKKGLRFSNVRSAFLKNDAQRWLVPPLHAHCLTTGISNYQSINDIHMSQYSSWGEPTCTKQLQNAPTEAWEGSVQTVQYGWLKSNCFGWVPDNSDRAWLNDMKWHQVK